MFNTVEEFNPIGDRFNTHFLRNQVLNGDVTLPGQSMILDSQIVGNLIINGDGTVDLPRLLLVVLILAVMAAWKIQLYRKAASLSMEVE